MRPCRSGAAAVATVESFLRSFGSIRLADVTYPIAREAARIRAAMGLSMPDAIVIATAVDEGADALVTDDRNWSAALDAATGGPSVIRLGAFVT